MSWFDTAKPFPTLQDNRVQVGVHFEEVCEMLDELSSHDPETQFQIQSAKRSLRNLAEHLKSDEQASIKIADKVKYLDSLLDQIVTAIGVGTFNRWDMVKGLSRVNKSLWSKYVDGKPVFHASGKIAKGPHYKPPVLDDLVK